MPNSKEHRREMAKHGFSSTLLAIAAIFLAGVERRSYTTALLYLFPKCKKRETNFCHKAVKDEKYLRSVWHVYDRL